MEGSPIPDTFVGPQREMADLKAALDDALAGQGRLIMLVGEPGIGKTRAAQELVAIARSQGAQTLWGRCHIVCNPLYTAYFATEFKDRLTVIDVLRNKGPRRFMVNNEEALGYLETLGLSGLRRRQLLAFPQGCDGG